MLKLCAFSLDALPPVSPHRLQLGKLEAPHLLGESPGTFRVGVWRNFSMTAWFGTPSAAAARQLHELTRATIEHVATPQFSTVHLVANNIDLPDSDARGELLRITRDYAPHLACVGVVVGGTGFWASAVRSFVTGLRVLGPRSFDMRIHGTIDEVLEWMPAEHGKRTGVQVAPHELGHFLQQGRAWQEEARAPSSPAWGGPR